MFSGRENQGYYEFDVRFHTRVSESNWFVMFYWLITKHTSAGALFHRQQTVCWISAQTKLSSIYRNELIVIYCALMKHQALLTTQAKLKLTIKLIIIIIFLLFGCDTIWRIPRNRVARGVKLWSPETLLYPNISNYSVFSVLGKSCYSSTYVKLGVKQCGALVKEAADYLSVINKARHN